jgi:hypothetical protein
LTKHDLAACALFRAPIARYAPRLRIFSPLDEPPPRRRGQNNIEALPGLERPPISLRVNGNLLNNFRLIWVIQPAAKKYSAFHPTQISGYFALSRLDKRGGSRVVTNAGRDAVDAAASGAMGVRRAVSAVSERRAQDDRRCSVRQNRVVLAPVAGVKLSVANSVQPDRLRHQAGSDGGKRNSSPGRARHKSSTHCAGDAGVLRLYLYARVRNSLHHCTRDRGCSKHPAFPAPSVGRERNFRKPRAQCVARMPTHIQLSSPAKAGDPVFQRRQ